MMLEIRKLGSFGAKKFLILDLIFYSKSMHIIMHIL